VELCLLRNTVDLLNASNNLFVDGNQVFCRGCGSVSLYNQSTDTLQVFVDFVQRTFSCLSDGNTVVSVTSGLFQTMDVGCETVSNRLTSSVVFCAVDTQTGGQTLNSGAQGVLGFGQVVLRNQRQVVSINN